jgi:hypothetical protein
VFESYRCRSYQVSRKWSYWINRNFDEFSFNWRFSTNARLPQNDSDAVSTSETSVIFCETTWAQLLEDIHNTHRHEILKSHISFDMTTNYFLILLMYEKKKHSVSFITCSTVHCLPVIVLVLAETFSTDPKNSNPDKISHWRCIQLFSRTLSSWQRGTVSRRLIFSTPIERIGGVELWSRFILHPPLTQKELVTCWTEERI